MTEVAVTEALGELLSPSQATTYPLILPLCVVVAAGHCYAKDHAVVTCTPIAKCWLFSAECRRTGRMESSRPARRIRDSRCAPGLHRVGHSGVRGRASEARDCRFRLQGECAADVQTSTLRQRPGCNGIRDIATVHERRMCRSSSNSLADAAM